MEKVLFEKTKKYADKVVRCYLTLDCNSSCYYCSAGINEVSLERKKTFIPATVWAEGLNRRKRAVVLAGGEPFLYPEFGKLIGLLEPAYSVWIYSNLEGDIRPFINNAGSRKYSFLVSLHPWANLERWWDNVNILLDNKHGIKFHLVESKLKNRVVDFMEEKKIIGKFSTKLCGDQRGGVKSRGKNTNDKYPSVNCTSRIFLFGPDGYRYPCVKLMGLNNSKERYEHIFDVDGEDWKEVRNCSYFGFCTGCDNNIEGKVIYTQTKEEL